MIPRPLRLVATCGVLSLAAILSTPAQGGPTTFQVAAGYDLFETDAFGTSFPGLGNLMGVPLGTFNFGGSIGVQNTGNTDTIIQRLQTATAPTQTAGAFVTIPLQMDALQLETVSPVNFMGLGVNNYFITLDPGTVSMGSMTITWNASGLGGTFISSLNVDFDIHIGSLTGTVINPGGTTLTLTSSGTTWSDLPPPGATTITGVNQYLSGVTGDPTQDFWVNPGPIVESHPTGAVHMAQEAGTPEVVPEPASVLMLGMGTIGLGIYGWRRRSRAA